MVQIEATAKAVSSVGDEIKSDGLFKKGSVADEQTRGESNLTSPYRWISIYETASRFYLVGSDLQERRFAVMKLERGGDDIRSLQFCDGGNRYDRTELNDLLVTLNEISIQSAANKPSTDKKGMKTSWTPAVGVTERVSKAYGILGFVRFLQGFYMIVVTKASQVGQIGYHKICKIEEVSMLYVPADTTTSQGVDEQRYLRLFQSVDLTTNFYFSYTYDLSRTLQENMINYRYRTKTRGPDVKFVWNQFLMQPALDRREVDTAKWMIPVVHGFIGEGTVVMPSSRLCLLLIGRRSARFSGTRFLKRGANLKGHVANDVETEQIIWDRSSPLCFTHGKFTSFVQRRGSVPLRWSQDPSNRTALSGKPPAIHMDLMDPYAQLVGAHFRELRLKYGNPVVIVNLVKRREKRRHEQQLHEHYVQAITYLNQFVPPDEAILYLSFDVARCHKVANALPNLEKIGYNVLIKHGWFQNFPPLYCHEVRPCSLMTDVNVHKKDDWSVQHGAPRTNCVDCLDRTNVAQFVIGKVALSYQLYAMGLLDEPSLSLGTELCRLLEMLFEDHGDTLALQYAGSQLVHSIKTYKKVAVFQERGRDVIQTLSRYYSNTFGDFDKQMAINLFLGVYQPCEQSIPLWELITDEYLHNISDKQEFVDYCAWFEPPEVWQAALKDNEDDGDDDSEDALDTIEEHVQAGEEEEMKSVKELNDMHQFEFNRFYRSWEMTSFDQVMSRRAATKTFSIQSLRAETAAGTTAFTFGIGGQWKRNTANAAAASSARSTSSTKKRDDSSSSEDDETETGSTGAMREIEIDYEDKWRESSGESRPVRPASSMSNVHSPTQTALKTGLLSLKEAYGCELHQPSKADMAKYERYVKMGGFRASDEDMKLMSMTKRLDCFQDNSIHYAELRPSSLYTSDSAFGVAVPMVSDRSRRIYELHVSRSYNKKTLTASTKDVMIYDAYARQYASSAFGMVVS